MCLGLASRGERVLESCFEQTALQVALTHHTVGGQLQAEQIYRQIIGQHPDHPDALHLLGLVLYQNGETEGAISYIEKALNSSTDYPYQNFHNSLGECLRAAGRPKEALEHYELALAIDADFTLAEFNSGLTYQEMNEWDTALDFYERVLAASRRVNGFGGSESEEAVVVEAQIRRCDLLYAQEHLLEARACWEEGSVWWAGNAQIRNELGNVYLQLGSLSSARESYEASVGGQHALARGLELAELNVAIVLELEGSTSQSVKRFEKALGRMRVNDLPDRHVMIKMATVLPRVLPDEDELDRLRRRMEQKLDDLLGLSWNMPPSVVDNSPPLRYGFSAGLHLAFHGENNRVIKTKLHRVYALFCPALLSGRFLTEGNIMQTPTVVAVAPPPADGIDRQSFADDFDPYIPGGGDRHDQLPIRGVTPPKRGETSERRIRVGWVSRFLYKHPVGLLCEGIIEKLPRDKYEVQVFMIRPWPAEDDHYSEEAFADDETFQRVLRSADQVAFWGHPDTSGVRNVDYFVSSEIEVADADRHYTEQLYRMRGLGAYFYRPQASSSTMEPKNTQLDPREIRETMRSQLGLPPSFHLYLCPQAIFKFHPAFDDMLVKILSRDRLAYLLLLNGKDRHAWSSMLVDRMTAKMNAQDQGRRILFYKVSGEREMLALYQAAGVVLDTYPAGSYLTSLQLAHNIDVRSSLSSRILALNYRLFHDTQAVSEWDTFLAQVVDKARRDVE
eukprot:g8776.t1